MLCSDGLSGVVPFDEITQAVSSGRVDAGLIIHESQITYRARGWKPC